MEEDFRVAVCVHQGFELLPVALVLVIDIVIEMVKNGSTYETLYVANNQLLISMVMDKLRKKFDLEDGFGEERIAGERWIQEGVGGKLLLPAYVKET